MDSTTIKVLFFHGSGQIVSVGQFCTYFTYVTIYVVNAGIIIVLFSRGDFSHVEMCVLEFIHFISQSVNILLYLV